MKRPCTQCKNLTSCWIEEDEQEIPLCLPCWRKRDKKKPITLKDPE